MPGDSSRPAIITLTTDFGEGDSYVAQMKGVILGINPVATIVDVCHEITPLAAQQALYLTQTAWPAFPGGTIHVCVVDPGVGTSRRALVLEGQRGWYIGPDNGVLSSALPEAARSALGWGGGPTPAAVDLPSSLRAFAINNRRYMREPVSEIFHGRDIFAPAAAHLSRGVEPGELGEPVQKLVTYPPLRAWRDSSGLMHARVIHIDRFGNAITNARAEDLPVRFVASIGTRHIPGPARTYADATALTAIIGSGGYLEIALPNGSAAEEASVALGDEVEIAERG